MDNETFHELALRVIAGEATDHDRQTLEVELSAHPELRADFDQLKVTHDVLRTTVPIIDSLQAQGPELPAYRVNELRTAVRRHFGPAAARKASSFGFANALRWIVSGGGVAALAVFIVLLNFSNHTIEIGVYSSDQMRSSDSTQVPRDLPSTRIMAFDQDASFDQWQNQPLAWYERAKVWVDNEHDLLHVVRRVNHGQISRETYPLAPTTDAQREQVRQMVEQLEK